MLAKRLYRYNLLTNIIYYYKVNRKFGKVYKLSKTQAAWHDCAVDNN